MENLHRCSLSPALLALLQLYATLGTSDTKRLARVSGRSRDTIETQFKHINRILGTSKRDEALIIALSLGWITLAHFRPTYRNSGIDAE